MLRKISIGIDKNGKVEHGQHIIKLDEAGGFQSHLLPISTISLSEEGPETPNAVSAPSPAPSEASSQATDVDGHLMAVRKTIAGGPFEDIPLKDNRSVLSGKLLQVLEKRKSQEADNKAKMEMEYTNNLRRRDEIHNQQLDLMEQAHTRTVHHLEEELERVRMQFSGAMKQWEEADQEIKELKDQLAAETKLRVSAERECEELSAVLEDNLI